MLRAPYGTWLKVLAGKIDPIQGMMTRQLKLKGNMMMIMRYPKGCTRNHGLHQTYTNRIRSLTRFPI